jgi:hypothetical protein
MIALSAIIPKGFLLSREVSLLSCLKVLQYFCQVDVFSQLQINKNNIQNDRKEINKLETTIVIFYRCHTNDYIIW